METVDLLIYTNDNGSTVTKISGFDTDFEEWFIARVKELGDDPNSVTCLHVWNDNGWSAESVWHPAYEETT